MQAVILAAGRGRRMCPLSDARHKGLLAIGGATILGRLVDELLGAGVSVIHVVTGYRAEEVERYLRERHPGAQLRFILNDRFAETNNVVSLALALEHVERGEDLMLVECDLLLAPGLLAGVARRGGENVALVGRYRTGMDGTVVALRDGIVVDVVPPHLQGAEFEYRGMYKTLNVYRFTGDFLDRTLRGLVYAQASEIDANAYYEVVLATLPDIARHRVAAEVVDGGSWAEVDDPNDLAGARFLFEPAARADILDRTKGGHWGLGVTDFSFMRNAYFPDAAMLAAMRHALVDLVGDYGSAQPVLDEKLAWFLGCAPQHLEVLAGASQAFPILRALWAGRTVAIPAPTFGEYARVFPAARTYRDAPGIASGALEGLAGEVDVLVVVNPNNPTGTTLETAALHDLAARSPATTFLVDESFIDFSEQPSMRSALQSEPLANVLVLCSLSKSLGVPGLRLGYVYGHDERTLAAIARELPIWNLGSPAEYFIELLLKFRAELETSLRMTAADRAALREQLLAEPTVAHVHESGGNFLLVELRGDADVAARIRRTLLARDCIEVKDVSPRFADGVGRLRIAVRRPHENSLLVQSLRALAPAELAPGELARG